MLSEIVNGTGMRKSSSKDPIIISSVCFCVKRKTVNKVSTIEERQNFQLYLTKQNKSARSNSFNCLNKRMVALFIVL